MKISVTQSKPEFRPTTLTLTLESADEVQALYDLTNWNSQAARAVRTHEPCASDSKIQRILSQIHGQLNLVYGSIGAGDNRLA